MKKYLKILLISLLVLLVVLAGLLFTQTGNNLLKPYLKAELEKQVGLPVAVDLFQLRYDNVTLKIVINKALNVDVLSIFNLLNQSFDGTYKIAAHNFIYNEINITQININGEFKGVPDDLWVNGQGTSFEAPLKYYLRIVEGDAKEVTATIKDINMADILALAKQPPIAKGKVTAKVVIPTLASNHREGQGEVIFSGLTFNDTLVQEVYNVALPEAFTMHGRVDANLSDTQLEGTVALKSNLASADFKNIKINTQTKDISAAYMLDILQLKAFSDLLHTKVDGALVLKGTIAKAKILKVTGATQTLGGEIHYMLLDNNFTASIMAVPAQNMLKMFRFPTFMDAEASGELHYNRLDKKGGSTVALENFRLASNAVTKNLGLVFQKDPSSLVFGKTSLDATFDGDEIIYSFLAKANQASIEIDKAKINRKKDTNEANIAFAYGSYRIGGNMQGSIRHPSVGFDTEGFLKDNMLKLDFLDKMEREIKRFLRKL